MKTFVSSAVQTNFLLGPKAENYFVKDNLISVLMLKHISEFLIKIVNNYGLIKEDMICKLHIITKLRNCHCNFVITKCMQAKLM